MKRFFVRTSKFVSPTFKTRFPQAPLSADNTEGQQ